MIPGKTFWLLVAVFFFASSATGTVEILDKSATLLREAKLEAEAARMEATAERIRESRRRGEGSVYLGFNVAGTLNQYAVKLREMGLEAEAATMEGYAKAYEEEQYKGFLGY